MIHNREEEAFIRTCLTSSKSLATETVYINRTNPPDMSSQLSAYRLFQTPIASYASRLQISISGFSSRNASLHLNA